jgi:AraC-like DNA-binding protein
MKPWLEKVVVETGCSWSLLNRRLDDEIPFEWHHHPEYELTLTLNSKGHRLVGDHSGSYDDGDLVLVGPNLPHSWCSHSAVIKGQPHVALVSWFTNSWAKALMDNFPELCGIESLLVEAQSGVHFSEAVAFEVRPMIEQLPQADAAERLLLLLKILERLSRDDDRKRLCTPSGLQLAHASSDERIRRVLDTLHMRYAEPLQIADLAQIACVSQSALHRLFLRHTRMTPNDYVTRLRIGRACTALSDGKLSIAAIADLSGYRNLANFNRQFRTLKGMTPREFRRSYQSLPPNQEKRQFVGR